MRILVLLPEVFNSVGGISMFSKCLLRALDELSDKYDFKVSVYILNDNKVTGSKFLDLKRVNIKVFKRNKVSFSVASLLTALSSDIVLIGHINFVVLILPVIILSKKLAKYLIVYGVDVWRKLSFFERTAVHKIDKIISISDFTKNEMIKHNNLEENKFYILPCTLEPESEFVSQELNIKSKLDLSLPRGLMLLTVSRLDIPERAKNIDQVIKALPEVLNHVPEVYYVIVGEGPDRERLEHLVLELGLSNKVFFKGLVEEQLLSAYYKNCDLFVLPSTKEGFGIVFLEAMNYSKPCVGAKAGGVPEVIENGVTGLLCKPDELNSLMKTLIKLLQDINIRTKMGAMGKEKYKHDFSFESYVKKVDNIIFE